MLLFAFILALSPVATHIVNTKGEEIVGRQLHATGPLMGVNDRKILWN